jgi:hypothetical protein
VCAIQWDETHDIILSLNQGLGLSLVSPVAYVIDSICNTHLNEIEREKSCVFIIFLFIFLIFSCDMENLFVINRT